MSGQDFAEQDASGKPDDGASEATGFEQKDGVAQFQIRVPVELHRPTLPPDGSLLVALHGMGMSPATFRRRALPLAPPGYTVLIPQGPLPYEMRSERGIRQGNAWYIYLGDEEQFVESMQSTEEWLLGMIDRYVEFHGLDPAAVSLLGFSQGAYLAGYVAIRNAHRFRRLVVAGGRIKHEVLLDDARRAAEERPDFEILAVHGEEDGSVALDAVRASVEAVAAQGIPTELRTYATGHAVLDHEPCRDDVKAFLVGAL